MCPNFTKTAFYITCKTILFLILLFYFSLCLSFIAFRYLIFNKNIFLLVDSCESISSLSVVHILLSLERESRSATDWNVYSKGWVRTGYDSSRVPMKYTFSTSKWIRKLIFDGHPVRWFGLVFQFSARRRRRRRDVIVKYDYSVSRRLFLTPGSSPSFSLVLATVRWSTNDRSVSSRSNHNDFRATISLNPASWLKYPAWAVFPRWDFH